MLSGTLYNYIVTNILLAVILLKNIIHKRRPTYAALQKENSILEENTHPFPFPLNSLIQDSSHKLQFTLRQRLCKLSYFR